MRRVEKKIYIYAPLVSSPLTERSHEKGAYRERDKGQNERERTWIREGGKRSWPGEVGEREADGGVRRGEARELMSGLVGYEGNINLGLV